MRFATTILAAAAMVSAADEPSVVTLARSAAPEVFADTAIKQVEAGKIQPAKRAVELLDEAFSAAQQARDSYRFTQTQGTQQTIRSQIRVRAGELKLDALSLQSRVIIAMIPIDQKRAYELFDAMPAPAVEARACGDPLIPDISAYGEAGNTILKMGITPDLREAVTARLQPIAPPECRGKFENAAVQPNATPDMRPLITTADGQPRAEGDRSTREWSGLLSDFLRDFESWQPGGDTMDEFHQKAEVCKTLIQITPQGEDRDRVVSLCASFFAASHAESTSPAEWLWQVREALSSSGPDSEKFLKYLRDAGNVSAAVFFATRAGT